MTRQRKFSKDLGKDTHARSVENNKFQKQSRQTTEILSGQVLINQPEPVFSQNAVTVNLSKGGNISGVGIPGAFIDPLTGNLHGVYEGLIPGQMVTLGFVDGNSSSPIILNKYPYQGVGNTLTEKSFITPMYLAGYSPNDTLMGNVSGSVIGLYTGLNPLGGRLLGSIGIDAFTECNITAQTSILLDALVSVEVKSLLVKVNSTTDIEINATTFVQIKTATQSMKTLVDGLLDLLTNFATAGSPTAQTTDPATKAAIAAEKVKWAALLK